MVNIPLLRCVLTNDPTQRIPCNPGALFVLVNGGRNALYRTDEFLVKLIGGAEYAGLPCGHRGVGGGVLMLAFCFLPPNSARVEALTHTLTREISA